MVQACDLCTGTVHRIRGCSHPGGQRSPRCQECPARCTTVATSYRKTEPRCGGDGSVQIANLSSENWCFCGEADLRRAACFRRRTEVCVGQTVKRWGAQRQHN